jgi:cytochrome c-type biogenesis protein CcmE
MAAGPTGRTLGPCDSTMKMMWGCVAVLAIVVVLVLAGANAGYLLFALPCMLMMGAMMWMMMGGMGGRGE